MIVKSNTLSAALFVGHPKSNENGKVWLHDGNRGFAFCADGVDNSFNPIELGDTFRMEVALEKMGPEWCEYGLESATRISGTADSMICKLFGASDYNEMLDDAVREHYGIEEDDEDHHDQCGDLEFTDKMTIWYRLVRL